MERERGEKKQTRKRSIVESKEERKKERKIEEEREREKECLQLSANRRYTESQRMSRETKSREIVWRKEREEDRKKEEITWRNRWRKEFEQPPPFSLAECLSLLEKNQRKTDFKSLTKAKEYPHTHNSE